MERSGPKVKRRSKKANDDLQKSIRETEEEIMEKAFIIILI